MRSILEMIGDWLDISAPFLVLNSVDKRQIFTALIRHGIKPYDFVVFRTWYLTPKAIGFQVKRQHAVRARRVLEDAGFKLGGYGKDI